ncbi:MAG TPA: glycosyl hydrolase family 18 protein [Candidatus Dormibacteraeota bacterium]|nr:glycosyl hydrolase family 18 protein [Candidatus Dormibacteraeota bacterium]
MSRALLLAAAILLMIVHPYTASAAPAPAEHDPSPPRIMQIAAASAAAPPTKKLAPFKWAPALTPRRGISSPSAGPREAPAAVGATSGPAREVFGFVNASELEGSGVGFKTWNLSDLTTVAFFGLHVNESTGALVTTDDTGWSVWNSSDLTDLLTAAHAAGVKVVLSILLQDDGAGMCTGLNHASTTVSQTVQQVEDKGVDGVNIDYEGANETCGSTTSRALLTSFVQKMRQALPSSSYLSIDTYGSSAADSGGYFDIGGIAPSVDSIFVMDYDLDGDYSGGNWQYAPVNCSSYCLTPTAPLTTYAENDTNTMQQYLAAVPASKIILGVPYFGWTACTTKSNPGANAVVQPTGGNPAPAWTSPTYLDEPAQGTSGVTAYSQGTDPHDTAGQEPYATWDSSTYNCWRESTWDDTASLGAKYDLVNSDNLRGVGIFTLDYGGGASELWSLLSSKFPSMSISSISPSSGGFDGGTSVTVTGQNFASGAIVDFGTNAATSVTVNSSTQITATAPPGDGTVAVSVTNPGGATASLAGSYTYQAAADVQYFSWYDHVSPGMDNDNIHVVNPGTSAANVVVNIPGGPGCTPYGTIPAGQEEYFSCANGFGGPVTVSSDQPVLTSQRVQYDQSFNEVEGQSASAAQTTIYLSWFDRVSSPGFKNDNVHVVDPGTSAANVTVSIPGNPGCTLTGTIQPGSEQYFTCANGYGGPVKITSDQPVLASQRVVYYNSFNEVLAEPASAAGTTEYSTWFDRVSSPGFLNDNVHVVDPGTTAADVTISIPGSPGCTLNGTIQAGEEQYFTCADGYGGPVKITSDQPVLVSERVQYYQSFNEVDAQPATAAQTSLDFTWFDRVSNPGFYNDNVHVMNPGTSAASVTVTVPGNPSCTLTGTIQPGAEQYFTCGTGIGGPVTVTSNQPVLASQRVQFYQSFNEVLGMAT